MEQQNKVAKLNEDILENEEQVNFDGEGSENQISDMDKLPNEILMKVLDYLGEQELVKNRLLSTRWNEICCFLLQDKAKINPESKLVVQLQRPKGQISLECTTDITKSFDEFLDCFSMTEAEKSRRRRRPFPFSCFKITDLYYMEKNQMAQFASLFVHIKKLVLDVKQREVKNFGIFWRLLLKFAPNIEHLGIFGKKWYNIELFEPCFNLKGDSDLFEITNVNDKTEVQDDSFLNKLKIFESTLLPFYNSRVTPIESLLENTPNVQQILNHDPLYLVGIWQRLGRAHLLKKLAIRRNSQSKLPPFELMKNLGLEDLIVDCSLGRNFVEDENSTTNYIYHALKASANTLTKLSLWSLTVKSMDFCFKDISSLPNVRRLEITIKDQNEAENIVERLCQLFPNITSLIVDRLNRQFPSVAPILWSKFKGLKFLKFSSNMTYKNTRLLVNSAFCGYSDESIKKINAKLKQGISCDEAREEEDQKPSILDLKDLSRLELQFWMGERTDKMKQVENRIRQSIFVKILPQHIQENPRSISFVYKN